MPYTDPVLSRINRYRLVLTQYHPAPTIAVFYWQSTPLHQCTVQPIGSSLWTFLLPSRFLFNDALYVLYRVVFSDWFPPLNSEVWWSTEKRDLLHLSSQMLREPVALTKEPSAMSNLWPDMEARMSPRLWTSLNSQNNVKRSSTCTRKGSGHSSLDPSW